MANLKYDGLEFSSIPELVQYAQSKGYGLITNDVLYDRINKKGQDPKTAIESPVQDRNYAFEFRGVTYNNFKEAVIAQKLEYNTVKTYKNRKKLSEVEALEYYMALKSKNENVTRINPRRKALLDKGFTDEEINIVLKTRSNIQERTQNPNSNRADSYINRGIKLHPQWDMEVDPEANYNFADYILTTLGPRPVSYLQSGRAEYSIDRIDNDGNYEPGNLRWATVQEQMCNNSKTVKVTFDGKDYPSLKNFCELNDLNYKTIHNSITYDKVSLEEAVRRARLNYQYSSSAIPVVYNGKTYHSTTNLAQSFGIPISTFNNRIAKGLSIEEAINADKTDTSITYKGVKYNSLKDVCSSVGLNYNTVKSRLETMTLEEALEKEHRVKPVNYKGVNYRSIDELCKVLGLNSSTINSRLKRGLTVEEAIELNTDVNRLDYKGVTYPSLRNLCENIGANYERVVYRINHENMTLEEAINKPIGGAKNIDYKGKVYSSLKELSESLGLNYKAIHARVSKGMSITEAVETPAKDFSIVYKDVTYPSLNKLCGLLGLDIKLMSVWVNKYGMSVEEAVEKGLAKLNKFTFKGAKFMIEMSDKFEKNNLVVIILKDGVYAGFGYQRKIITNEEISFEEIENVIKKFELSETLEFISIMNNDKEIKGFKITGDRYDYLITVPELFASEETIKNINKNKIVLDILRNK